MFQQLKSSYNGRIDQTSSGKKIWIVKRPICTRQIDLSKYDLLIPGNPFLYSNTQAAKYPYRPAIPPTLPFQSPPQTVSLPSNIPNPGIRCADDLRWSQYRCCEKYRKEQLFFLRNPLPKQHIRRQLFFVSFPTVSREEQFHPLPEGKSGL